jgi:histidine ammonia-lyase
MIDNVADIVAIELLAAVQGVELREKRSSPPLQDVFAAIRELSPFYDEERSLSLDVRRVAATIDNGDYCHYAASILPSLSQ